MTPARRRLSGYPSSYLLEHEARVPVLYCPAADTFYEGEAGSLHQEVEQHLAALGLTASPRPKLVIYRRDTPSGNRLLRRGVYLQYDLSHPTLSVEGLVARVRACYRGLAVFGQDGALLATA